jgi:hypothetical protein
MVVDTEAIRDRSRLAAFDAATRPDTNLVLHAAVLSIDSDKILTNVCFAKERVAGEEEKSLNSRRPFSISTQPAR